MKQFLIASVPALFAVGCLAPTNKVESAKLGPDKMLLSYASGLGKPFAHDQAVSAIPFVGALLSFATKQLGVWANSKAETYEVKSKAGTLFRIDGVRGAAGSEYLGQFDFNGDVATGMGGVFLFVRTTTMPLPPDGASLGAALDALVIDSRRADGSVGANSVAEIARQGNLTLEKWGGGCEGWIKAELERAGALPAGSKSVASVVSAAALVVLQPATTQAWTVGVAGSQKRDLPDALQLVLAGYTYPLQRPRVGEYLPVDATDARVKALLTMSLLGPLGPTTGPLAKFDASATFALQSNAARAPKGADGKPLVGKALAQHWVDMSLPAAVPPHSGAIAIPWPPILNAQGALVETNDAKRTFENLSKLLGELKLTPKDIGLE